MIKKETYESYIGHLRRRADTINGEFSYINPITLKYEQKQFELSLPLIYVVDFISYEIIATNDGSASFGRRFNNINAAKIFQVDKLLKQDFGETHLFKKELISELKLLLNEYPEYII